MATLTDQQAACYLNRAGWPQSLIPTMVAIGHAESGLNTDAQGPAVGANHAVGWLQVMDFPDRTARWNLTDPLQNAQAAKSVYDSQGLGAWTTYPGDSARYLGAASAALTGWDYGKCGSTSSSSSPATKGGSGLLSGSQTDPWGIGQSIADGVGSLGSVAGGIGRQVQNSGTLLIGLLIVGAGVALLAWMFLQDTGAGQKIKAAATDVAVVVPK